MVLVKKILRKNQIMITALAVMIAVAGYLNFAGTKIGEEDFLSVDGSDMGLTYEISDEDIYDSEDMYAVSLREDTEGTVSDYSDIASMDTDDITVAENYLDDNMDLIAESKETADHGVLDASADATDATVTEDVPGEAIFTSASGVSTIAGAKLAKEQTRAQNKEALMDIINNESLTDEAKQDAINSMIVLTETAQKESDAQMLLEAKGFAQTVVSISGESADVMVGAASLTDAQTAQIIDIVQRKTDIAPENIIITVSAE